MSLHVRLWEFDTNSEDTNGEDDTRKFQSYVIDILVTAASPIPWIEDTSAIWTWSAKSDMTLACDSPCISMTTSYKTNVGSISRSYT